MEFCPKHNVRAIKGRAMKYLFDEERSRLTPKDLSVMFKDRALKDKENLLELQCGNIPVIVTVIKE